MNSHNLRHDIYVQYAGDTCGSIMAFLLIFCVICCTSFDYIYEDFSVTSRTVQIGEELFLQSHVIIMRFLTASF